MITAKSNPKEQNEYAKNVKGEPIYILEAKSGREEILMMGYLGYKNKIYIKENNCYKWVILQLA